MFRQSVRTMISSGTALESRPFRVRQHDIEVFYALVGGGKSPAKSMPLPKRREREAAPPSAPMQEPQSGLQAPSAPARPVRRPPATSVALVETVCPVPAQRPCSEPSAAAIGTSDNAATNGSSADWAAALDGITPASRPLRRARARPSRRGQLSWSPKLLCKLLVDRVDQLHVNSWMRKVSGEAVLRLSEAQTRLNSARPKL